MKTILDFEASQNPKNEDVLVFDAYNKIFKQQTKASFLKTVFAKIDEQETEIKNLQNEITNLQNDIQALARILKGAI